MADIPTETPLESYKEAFGTVLVLGGTGGLGSSIVKRFVDGGCEVYATVRKANDEIRQANPTKIIEGIDFLDKDCGKKLASSLGEVKFDTVMSVAGYFKVEALGNVDFDVEVRTYTICTIAPVILTDALNSGGFLKDGCRLGFITSEGGSIGLRTLEEGGGNYSHHGSKAAQNMVCKMLAYDLHPRGISVVMIHPGFLKTEMTADKYAHKYEEFGAVTAAEAAPHIIDCVARLTLETTARFVAAMGAKGLGLGVNALENPEQCKPGSELPW